MALVLCVPLSIPRRVARISAYPEKQFHHQLVQPLIVGPALGDLDPIQRQPLQAFGYLRSETPTQSLQSWIVQCILPIEHLFV
jgi:hypothetical protein